MGLIGGTARLNSHQSIVLNSHQSIIVDKTKQRIAGSLTVSVQSVTRLTASLSKLDSEPGERNVYGNNTVSDKNASGLWK